MTAPSRSFISSNVGIEELRSDKEEVTLSGKEIPLRPARSGMGIVGLHIKFSQVRM